MILLVAVVAGFLAGLVRTRWMQGNWQLPDFRHTWLVAVFFIPQLFAFYLPGIRNHLSAPLVAACLLISQAGLMLFCLVNKQMPGMPILTIGLLLNLIAIIANGGLMPLSTVTAASLVPAQTLANLEIGSRFSSGSKDILLTPELIIFPWLADCFVPPSWFPYRFAFSPGDIFIGIGAFILLAFSPKSVVVSPERL